MYSIDMFKSSLSSYFQTKGKEIFLKSEKLGFKSLTAVGLEPSSHRFKAAELSFKKGKPHLHRLWTLQTQNLDLDVDHPIIVTAIESQDVLVRPLQLPLTKEKDIQAALAFQMEPVLPYPIDNALLARQTLSQEGDHTNLTVLSTQKDSLKRHLESWEELNIIPEQVSCAQMALCQFGHYYMLTDKPYLILHREQKWMTCLLVKGGKLMGSYVVQDGTIDLESDDSLKRLQQITTQMGFALMRENKEIPEGILVTGDLAKYAHIQEKLAEKLNLPLLHCLEADSYSPSDIQYYALPIGLAIGGLQNGIDFRQQDFSYPHPWKRVTIPLATYLIGMLLLASTFYLFGKVYLASREKAIKQEYVDLLASMNKPYEKFEGAFLAKHPNHDGEIVDALKLNREELQDRLTFLQKDLQGTPDSFPLYANIPRVSDVLAWLGNHPLVTSKDANGEVESRLQIENFTYTMLKRPVQGKKQERYQVKVELEFTSPTPKWAREFHDALISSNDLVDPKGEVKWGTNRGSYRTSFYLKDKTLYPSQ